MERALPELCKSHGLHRIVEFGCGAGVLGAETLAQAQRSRYKLSWVGIERNTDLHSTVKRAFDRKDLESPSVFARLEEADNSVLSLYVFPYCLDSMPPTIVRISASAKQGSVVPDQIIGVVCSDTKMREVIISSRQLAIRNISFESGCLQKTDGCTFDLARWALEFPDERAYVPLEAVRCLFNAARTAYPKSEFLIIDEITSNPGFGHSRTLCEPKIFGSASRGKSAAYEDPGRKLLYFPTTCKCLQSILSSLGFVQVSFDIDERLASGLRRRSFYREKNTTYRNYAFLASARRGKLSKVITV